MKIFYLVGCISALVGLAASPAPARTGFNGSTVTATLYYPNLAWPGPTVTTTVGNDMEFPVGAILARAPYSTFPFSINISNEEIQIITYFNTTFPHGSANVIVLTFTGAPVITGFKGSCTACVVGSEPGEGPSFTATSFSINAAGATVNSSDVETAHFTFAPEASTP